MRQVLFACLLMLWLCTGCGGPGPVPVKGTVTFNGKPVANVNVVLIGSDGKRANGITDASGNFSQLTTIKEGDGAVPGEYTVVITPKTDVNQEPTKADDYAVPDASKQAFPPKYSDVTLSGLKVTVTGGANDLKVDLK